MSMLDTSQISKGFEQNSEASWSRSAEAKPVIAPPSTSHSLSKTIPLTGEVPERCLQKTAPYPYYQSPTTSPAVREKNYPTEAVFISRASQIPSLGNLN